MSGITRLRRIIFIYAHAATLPMSSFFDDTQNFGLALFIAGIAGIVCSILALVTYVLWAATIGYVIVLSCIGGVLTSLLILLYGMIVRGSENKAAPLEGVTKFITPASYDKPGLLSGLTFVVGITSIITGVVNLLILNFGGVLTILFGIFFIWAAPQIRGESTGFDKHLLWIILLVIFILSALFSLITVFTVVLAVFDVYFLFLALEGLCMLIVNIFAIIFITSPEVKSLMNSA